MRATEPFAREQPSSSWRHAGVVLALLTIATLGAVLAPWWPLRIAAALIASLLLVRAFILYHDYMHGAILQESRIAKGLFHTLGVLMLAPPRAWRYGHNFHHAHVGDVDASGKGSFPVLTTEDWRKASRARRLRYRLSRHPLTIAFAYLTVFVYSICLESFIENPRRYWDSALSLLLHAGILAALWILAGPVLMLTTFLLPLVLTFAFGAYLFYSQHNFEGERILAPDEWTYDRAALESSSYLRLGPVLSWFTGNIGYHHVHHLNPLIPFYRLPQAMAAIPELQSPAVTTLSLREIRACLRLKLWDPVRGRMVCFREARAHERDRVGS